jgi:hypothetical protein
MIENIEDLNQACKRDGFCVGFPSLFCVGLSKSGMGIENPVRDASLYKPDLNGHRQFCAYSAKVILF